MKFLSGSRARGRPSAQYPSSIADSNGGYAASQGASLVRPDLRSGFLSIKNVSLLLFLPAQARYSLWQLGSPLIIWQPSSGSAY